MLGLMKNQVSLCLYDYQYWQKEYMEEKTRLISFLKGRYIAIEHVGSTAIPGIVSKPIVDIAIGLCSMGKEADECKAILIENGYEFKPQNGGNGRLLFIKVNQSKRTHHIHVEKYGGEAWVDHIDFRNCMRESLKLQKQYELLKRTLAEQFPSDRKMYTEQKAEFIQNVLSLYRTAYQNH